MAYLWNGAFLMSALHQVITGYAQGGGVAPYNPASEFGGGKKGLWWDQSDLSTMYSDSGMTTQAVLNGPVLKIADKSGNGWHGTCTACTLLQDANGKYYIGTNGSTSEIATSFTGSKSMFMSFGVFRTSDDGNTLLAYRLSANSSYLGTAISGSGAAAEDSSGAPQHSVDGANFANMTRDQFNTAWSLVNPHVVQVAAVDMTLWTTFKVGAYNTLGLKGGFYGCIIVENANTATGQGLLQYHAAKSGATVAYGAGGNAALAVGDSTVAAYLGQNDVISYVTTSKSKQTLAVPGQNISQQLAVWLANPYRPVAAWVVVEVGLNDIAGTGDASGPIAALQGLVNQIRADTPASCKIIISKITPAKQSWIDLYGASPGAVAQQNWLDLNAAIAGTGATPITGVDARSTAHVPLLDDGTGNLAATYEITGTVDHIHENNSGRSIVANNGWVAAMNAAGITV
jgi:hypothetical protein